MRLTIALMLLAFAPAVQAQTLSTVSDLYSMPPDALGDAWLPAGHPEIARVQFGSRGPVAAEFDRVYLFSVGQPLTSDFCVQQQFSVQITPVSLKIGAPLTAMPQRIGEPEQATLYRDRSGDGCDGGKPHFGVYLGPLEQGLDAVRALKAAIDLTARDRLSITQFTPKLGFTLTCHDYRFARCNAREMLARLDPGMLTSIVIPPRDQLWAYDAMGEAAARGKARLFDMDFDAAPMESLTVTMLMRDGRITRMEIARGRTSY